MKERILMRQGRKHFQDETRNIDVYLQSFSPPLHTCALETAFDNISRSTIVYPSLSLVWKELLLSELSEEKSIFYAPFSSLMSQMVFRCLSQTNFQHQNNCFCPLISYLCLPEKGFPFLFCL